MSLSIIAYFDVVKGPKLVGTKIPQDEVVTANVLRMCDFYRIAYITPATTAIMIGHHDSKIASGFGIPAGRPGKSGCFFDAISTRRLTSYKH